MNFIDKVRVYVAAGDGGDGSLSFRHLKFLEFGGPNGGDGGKGGDVWFEAASRLTTLMDLHFRPHVEAKRGSHGKGSNWTGDSGGDITIFVPVGTVIHRDRAIVADLHKDGQRWLAAAGGRGGRGNHSFKNRHNTAPRLAEKGGPGEKATLDLELKLLADVGMVGFPNAGKSSFLARVSRARPKIADYPFTTLSPNLGVAYHKHVSFVVADLPGLIEGAAEGKGLGVQFLRHTERTRVLIHLIDPAGYMGEDPVSGVKTIEKELKTFSPKLAKEPRILVVNKMDLPEGAAVFKALKKKYRDRVLAASVATGEGVDEILDRVIELLATTDGPVHFEDKVVDETLHKVEQGFTIENMGGGVFMLRGKYVERVSAMLDVSLPEAIERYQNTLRRIGVDRALKKADIKAGDKVRCGAFEFEWTDKPNRKLPIKRGDKRTRIGVGKKMNTVKEYEARLLNPNDVAGAYDFCSNLARRHYENFPVASLLMPKALRRHVAALYAFARIADDFSDEPEYEGVRQKRLLDWRRQLNDIGSKPPSHPVFLALGATLRELDLPKEPFDDLLSAFLQDTEKRRYATFDEVADYCRRSANPVGRIVLMIHGHRDEELFRYSDAICTALQLANFWQDVSVDLTKDRIYIPEEDFKSHDYSEADLRMGVCNERFKSLMKFEVARARSLFEQGRPLLGRLRFPLSLEIRMTWLGGMQILKKIHRIDFDVIRTRPALKKREWIPLAARALAGA